jgi:hypothetical protein
MTDPRHWLETNSDASGLERAVLGSDLDETPPAGSEEAVWSRLMVSLGPMPGGPPGGGMAGPGALGPSGVGAGAARALKALAVGVVAGAMVTGGVLAARDARQAQSATRLTAVAIASPMAFSAEPVVAPVPHAAPCTSSAVNPPARFVALSSGARVAPAPSALARPADSAVAVLALPDANPPAASGSAAGQGRPSRLSEEAGMVREARAALARGAFGAALGKLEALRSRFPGGELLQEREALTIELLYRTGQRDAAQQRGREFLARYPTSPHAAAVRRLAAER